VTTGTTKRTHRTATRPNSSGSDINGPETSARRLLPAAAQTLQDHAVSFLFTLQGIVYHTLTKQSSESGHLRTSFGRGTRSKQTEDREGCYGKLVRWLRREARAVAQAEARAALSLSYCFAGVTGYLFLSKSSSGTTMESPIRRISMCSTFPGWEGAYSLYS
jgi:hypothetical protein